MNDRERWTLEHRLERIERSLFRIEVALGVVLLFLAAGFYGTHSVIRSLLSTVLFIALCAVAIYLVLWVLDFLLKCMSIIPREREMEAHLEMELGKHGSACSEKED